MAKRSDSRRGKGGTSNRAAAAKNRQKERGGFARWMRRLAIGGVMAALLVVLFAGLAVAFAARSLPSFYQLQATQVGQTIVVRARDGSEIVELGPSFGEWLDAGQDIVAVESV